MCNLKNCFSSKKKKKPYCFSKKNFTAFVSIYFSSLLRPLFSTKKKKTKIFYILLLFLLLLSF